jgi:RNA polymerase sigma factor (sigma-70 family)
MVERITTGDPHVTAALGRNAGRAPDEVVSEGFVAGDPGAVASVRGWSAAVVGFGRWNFRDPDAVIQDILVKVLEIVRRGGFGGSSSFKTFVFSVAKHTCVDVYRHERWASTVEVNVPIEEDKTRAAEATDDGLHRADRIELLKYIFQKLPEECRRLWGWVYGQRLPTEDVAGKLGISAANVRVRVHRCLQKARAIGNEFIGRPELR